jgi:hypothetical protein
MIKLAPDDNISSQMITSLSQIISTGTKVIKWDEMLSSGTKGYHLG